MAGTTDEADPSSTECVVEAVVEGNRKGNEMRVLMVWTWLVALLTLFAGSLASHVKVMLLEGHSAAEAARRHVSRPSDGAADAA